MRVVSQDGMFDFPYEKCCVWFEDKSVILSPISEPGSNYTYAKYSTKEKAMKAMEMLRSAYTGMPVIFQNVEPSEDVERMFERTKMNGIVAITDDKKSKIEYVNNAVFQFPKDEEVEG